jgi:hypothetical protein
MIAAIQCNFVGRINIVTGADFLSEQKSNSFNDTQIIRECSVGEIVYIGLLDFLGFLASFPKLNHLFVGCGLPGDNDMHEKHSYDQNLERIRICSTKNSIENNLIEMRKTRSEICENNLV